MPKYEIEITRTAEKQFKKLPKTDQRRVAGVILDLASDPHPMGSKKLTDYKDVYRVRTGQYRILYSVAKRKLVVIIFKIGHRKGV